MEYKNLENKINVQFKNIKLLDTALTHRSYLNESKEKDIESNERLEFLGDAILQFLCSEYIFLKYEEFPEGELTNLRSKIVNTESLASESTRLDLPSYIKISKGEKEAAYTSGYILANSFESLIGAIYLDQGLDAVKKFLHDNLFYKINALIETGELKDAKSLFQELAQEKYGVTPKYDVISEDGPDHDKKFTVGLYINAKLVSTGTGNSKRKAQQDAAQNALNSAKRS